MRLRFTLPPLLIAAVAAGGIATVHAAGDRQRTFADSAGSLRATWDRDVAEGVPASSLAPLRAELASARPTAAWWSPAWLRDDGHALIASLSARTLSAWNAALEAKRGQAQALIVQWTTFAGQQAAWLTSQAAAAPASWPAELSAAGSPGAVDGLISTWKAFLTEQQGAVVGAQQARLAAELRSAGGPQAVLATARRLVAAAASANLDAGNVGPLADRLAADISAGSTDSLAAGTQLLTAVTGLQSLLNLNNQVDAQVRPLVWSLDQAQAEGTPHAAALAAQDGAVAAQFRAARTADQLNAAAQAVSGLTSQVATELAANQCGHPVGGGKVITISLSLQEMVFYENGCVARATPVSTGRPQLRTPTGTFAIFYKRTPFTFVSPWPPSSPFYYYPSPVSWVMEFAAGGYFIHDAPWESAGSYGPGSEDNPSAASHGCVHTPTSVMQWAFGWTPTGTAVIISA